MKKLLIYFIELYQKYFSPDHSPRGKIKHPHGYCRFYPTCSQYAKESLEKYGVVKGLIKGLWRVMRCNPCSGGGVDEV